jgi:hypothetical protein
MDLDRGIALTPDMAAEMECDALAVFHDPGNHVINVQVMVRAETIGVVAITEEEYGDTDQDLADLVRQRFIGSESEPVEDIAGIMDASLNETIN